jgi:exo-beta-1,3-glucanase (GH17 family)
MSYRKERLLSYKKDGLTPRAGFYKDKSEEDLHNLFLEVISDAMHGICFSAYDEGQKPGDILTEAQIRRKLEILKPYVKWIRTFSCIEGNELIPKIAREYGLKTLVGAWLGSDKDKNEEEITGLIKLANEGYVDIAAVGNEVLYRGDLNEEELLDYIYKVKNELPNIPVGYVDAYYEFAQRPAITEASDVILANCYPYWEGTPYEHSLDHMAQMIDTVKNVANGKKIIISETGWPNKGESLGGAVPSHYNALKYFINTQLWTLDENIEAFYFSSFDEDWKVDSEGDVGGYWGLWDKTGKLKY